MHRSELHISRTFAKELLMSAGMLRKKNCRQISVKQFINKSKELNVAKAFLGNDTDEPAGETSVDGDFAHRRDM